MGEDLKEFELLKSGLKIVAFAFLLLVIQMSLYYLLNPEFTELTFTFDEKPDILPSLIAITPISALIEELGLRLFPHFIVIGLIQGWPRFTNLLREVRGSEEAKLDVLMIPLFGVLNGVLHLSNVASASPMNIVKYSFTHFLGGAYLGAIYLRHGFRQVYATHLLYDMMVFGLLFLPDTFW
jgi:hypothetical protein